MKSKNIPMRRCVGCRESKPKSELVRMTYYEGRLSLDTTGKAKGRGIYVCPSEDCIGKAVKKNAFNRSVNGNIREEDIEEIVRELTILKEEC